MKVKEDRLRAAIDRRPADLRLFLLHGPDEAGALAWAERLARSLGEGVERVDLDGAALKQDPARLADEAASLSLFGEARYIRVTGAGEESLAAVEGLLAAAQAAHPVVVIAPGVKTTGALVKAAAASDRAVAFGCYVPEGDAAGALASGLAKGVGLRLTRGAALRLAAASDGDRGVMARELEKLALYLDAAPEGSVEADESALEAVGAAIGEAELDTMVAAVVDGDARGLALALRQRGGGDVSPVPLFRALARRLTTLAEMRAALDGGEAMEQVTKRVFWRDQGPTAATVRRWNAAALATALARVRQLERASMSAAMPGPVLAAQALVGMAQRGKPGG